ncbi:MAG: rhomboid family intramembrane serine protease [Bacteroidaceae bacterium]|nr:rhomboid family intramembrane serine protease [Bacteroidaceae bacterium]
MITYIIIAVTVLVSWRCFNRPELLNKLALIPFRVVHNNEWYRLLSHGFVHADTTHLLVNMFTFWSFGTYLETLFERVGFPVWAYPILYFGGMIAASLYDVIKRRNDPYFVSVGASGAVSAVLFSSIFFDPWSKILLFAVIPIPGIVFGVLYLIYCQYMDKRAKDRINHNAHFYGAVFGFIFPLFLNPSLIYVFLSHF